MRRPPTVHGAFRSFTIPSKSQQRSYRRLRFLASPDLLTNDSSSRNTLISDCGDRQHAVIGRGGGYIVLIKLGRFDQMGHFRHVAQIGARHFPAVVRMG